jgi:DNA gyrase subunit B
VNEDFGIERIRKRPGMFVGPLDDGEGLHNMVYEAVGNAINEALASHATRIIVCLNSDGSCTVRDDGRGLSTQIDPRFGVTKAEAIMTLLHADSGNYLPHGPIATLCTVNALSDWLEVHIHHDGNVHRMRFRRGKLESPLTNIGETTAQHGTTLTFLPDASIFANIEFDRERLASRFRELTAKYAVPIDFNDAKVS